MPDEPDVSRATAEGKRRPWSNKGRVAPRAILVSFLAFLALAAALHHQGFHAPMVYDARAWIQNKAPIYQTRHLSEALSIVPARPLFIASLYANFVLTDMDPSYFRWTNAAMLAATSVALLVLCMLIFQISRLKAPVTGEERFGIGLFLALLFTAHPLQSFVVLYIWQREALMGCLFFLSALAAYVAGRSGRLRQGPLPYALTGTLFFAGMLCKENVITLPAILLVAEITLFGQRGKELWNKLVAIVAITGLPFGAYLVLTHILGSAQSVHTTSVIQRLVEYYDDAGIGPMEVALTQSRVLLSYLFMILAPSLSGLPLLKAEVISRSLWQPPITSVAVAAVLGLLVAGLGVAAKRPVASFGVLFFLIVSLPEALCIPQYLFCGYRAILPMTGVLLVLGDCLLWLLPKVRARLSSIGFAAAAICITLLPLAYLSAVTVGQAGRWNPLQFWQDQYKRLPPFSGDVAYRPYSDILANYGEELVASGQFDKAIAVLKQATAIEMATDSAWSKPDTSPSEGKTAGGSEADARANLRVRGSRGSKVTALVNQGAALKQSGDPVGAVALYRRAVELDPRSALAHYSLAGGLKDSREIADAIKHYRKALELEPNFAAAHNGLGLVLEESGNPNEAMVEYRKAVELNPGLAEAHNNLATMMERSGQLVEAIEHYTSALQSNPGLGQAHHNLGLLLMKLGKPTEAVQHLKKAVELGPESPEAHYALANALLKTGKPKEAVPYFRRALQENPGFLEAHANLGLVLLGLGDIPEAVASLQKAVEIDPKSAGLHNALGVALTRLGKRDEAIHHFRQAVALDPNDSRPRENLQKLTGENTASP